MTRDEHRDSALVWLDESQADDDASDEYRTRCVMRAQVHATLALTADAE